MREPARFKRFYSGVAIAFAVLVSAAAFADDGVLTRNAHLRKSPSTSAASLGVLPKGEELEILDPTPRDGFLRVATEEEEGWVWAKFVRRSPPPEELLPEAVATTAAAADTIPAGWAKPEPTVGTFTVNGVKCGPDGSGEKRDKLTNRLKNRTDVPSDYHAVTWKAIASLPYPTPSPKSRMDFTPEQLQPIERFEGAAVQTVGYIVAIKPQKGNTESCNCSMKGEAATDWHIALVEHPGDGEATSVVVEPTPRIKKQHPKWTPKNLSDWLNSDVPVRISGWLLFDPQHRNHLKKYRSTLWEIHPITRIEVWDRDSETWIDLDELEPES